jgi:hypothetical protein
MAYIFRGQAGPIARPLALLSALLLAVLPSPATAQLYEQPALVIDLVLLLR